MLIYASQTTSAPELPSFSIYKKKKKVNLFSQMEINSGVNKTNLKSELINATTKQLYNTTSNFVYAPTETYPLTPAQLSSLHSQSVLPPSASIIQHSPQQLVKIIAHWGKPRSLLLAKQHVGGQKELSVSNCALLWVVAKFQYWLER